MSSRPRTLFSLVGLLVTVGTSHGAATLALESLVFETVSSVRVSGDPGDYLIRWTKGASTFDVPVTLASVGSSVYVQAPQFATQFTKVEVVGQAGSTKNLFTGFTGLPQNPVWLRAAQRSGLGTLNDSPLNLSTDLPSGFTLLGQTLDTNPASPTFGRLQGVFTARFQGSVNGQNFSWGSGNVGFTTNLQSAWTAIDPEGTTSTFQINNFFSGLSIVGGPNLSMLGTIEGTITYSHGASINHALSITYSGVSTAGNYVLAASYGLDGRTLIVPTPVSATLIGAAILGFTRRRRNG